MIRNQHHQVAKDSHGLVATDRQRQDNLCPTATELGRMLEVHSCSDLGAALGKVVPVKSP